MTGLVHGLWVTCFVIVLAQLLMVHFEDFLKRARGAFNSTSCDAFFWMVFKSFTSGAKIKFEYVSLIQASKSSYQ